MARTIVIDCQERSDGLSLSSEEVDEIMWAVSR